MVCRAPMGGGESPYARPLRASSTKRCRRTLPMARSTRASRTPRRVTCSVTMRSLGMANSIDTSGAYLSTPPARKKAPFSSLRPSLMLDGRVPDSAGSGQGSAVHGQAPGLQLVDDPVIGEVQVKRGHGDPSAGHRVVIRVSQALPRGFDPPDPVVGLAARVNLTNHGLAVDAAALASDRHATDGVGREIGHIHVQKRVSRQPPLQDLFP